jgi:hypothetical protein
MYPSFAVQYQMCVITQPRHVLLLTTALANTVFNTVFQRSK